MTNPQGSVAVATDSQIAERIKDAIKENKKQRQEPSSLLALAQTTNITYPTIRRSIDGGIKGHRSLTVCELGAIAAALELLPSSLIKVGDAE